ncbi:MAG: MFS transporter [bacterium]|nr:MFS transporter [bacterium]
MNRRALYFFISYFISLVLAINFQLIPPLIPHIIREWGITRSQAGLISGTTALPPLFLGIFGGYFLDRFGNKKPVIVATLFYMLGETLFILANRFSLLLLSRVVLGFGGIIFAIVGLRILAEEFQGENYGKAVGFWSTGLPVAVVISFNIFSPIATRYHWKTPMYIVLGFTVLLFILILFFYKEKSKESEGNNIEFLKSIRELSPKVWHLGIIWFLFNAGSLSFLTFAPDYFISRGLSPTYASSVSSLYIMGAFLSPVIGYLLDRTKRHNLILFTGAVLLSLSLMLVYFLNFPLMIIIAGIFSVLVPPSIFYLLPKITDKYGLGYAILSLFVNLSTVFVPYLIGYARDVSGTYFTSFLLMSTSIFLSGLFGLNLKLKEEIKQYE